jgi:hypothetical protein
MECGSLLPLLRRELVRGQPQLQGTQNHGPANGLASKLIRRKAVASYRTPNRFAQTLCRFR